MFKNSKFLFLNFIYFAFAFLFSEVNQLSAYVVMPRSTADTTDRMNMGGDPADRAGLRDSQRSTEYIDDWWGRKDYDYMEYQSRDIRSFRHPTYDLNRPPYYPYPNTYYYDAPSSYPYGNGGARYYQPYYQSQTYYPGRAGR